MTENKGGNLSSLLVKPAVYVVDDSPEMCLSLTALLEAHGYNVTSFISARQFLAVLDALEPGVLLLDLRMEEMSGLEVIQKLGKYQPSFPTIMITGHGDIEVAVRAIKSGAHDFVQKPFRDSALIQAIQSVSEQLGTEQGDDTSPRSMLTGRERSVAERLAKGLSNKQIAYDLGISVRTVEMHRANAMQRLGCKSFADLLRVMLAA